MIHVDISASDDCINIHSYGEICVRCGCCSRNPSYRDMIKSRLRYYKDMLKCEYNFSDWDKNPKWRKVQEDNVKANILYYKRKIRLCKKILKRKKVRNDYFERE